MTRLFCIVCIACGVVVSAAGLAAAHGDIHERIAALTKRIAQEPANADLYLKRGELYHAHREWDAALADYARAQELNPRLTDIDLYRGLTYLAAGRLRPAQSALDRFLATRPSHVSALIARARVRVRLGDGLTAADDFSRAIAVQAQPELYLERARALVGAGNQHVTVALAGLDEGIARLGPLVTLQLYAIDLEMRQRRYDAALARIETLAAQSPRKETWLARKGEILEQAGRRSDARAAYTAALAALNGVPEARRSTRATVELDARVRGALHRLKE